MAKFELNHRARRRSAFAPAAASSGRSAGRWMGIGRSQRSSEYALKHRSSARSSHAVAERLPRARVRTHSTGRSTWIDDLHMGPPCAAASSRTASRVTGPQRRSSASAQNHVSRPLSRDQSRGDITCAPRPASGQAHHLSASRAVCRTLLEHRCLRSCPSPVQTRQKQAGAWTQQRSDGARRIARPVGC